MKDDPVAKSIALHQRVIARNATKPVTLPTWPTTKRGVPNTFLRSALFSATKPLKDEDRGNLTRVVCACREAAKFDVKQAIRRHTKEKLEQKHLYTLKKWTHRTPAMAMGLTQEALTWRFLFFR